MPGVRSARVNLTQKRVSVEADAGRDRRRRWSRVLDRLGYEAHELDAGLLSATETDRQGRELADAAGRRRFFA